MKRELVLVGAGWCCQLGADHEGERLLGVQTLSVQQRVTYVWMSQHRSPLELVGFSAQTKGGRSQALSSIGRLAPPTPTQPAPSPPPRHSNEEHDTIDKAANKHRCQQTLPPTAAATTARHQTANAHPRMHMAILTYTPSEKVRVKAYCRVRSIARNKQTKVCLPSVCSPPLLCGFCSQGPNQGRYFYNCARQGAQRCSSFTWADQKPAAPAEVKATTKAKATSSGGGVGAARAQGPAREEAGGGGHGGGADGRLCKGHKEPCVLLITKKEVYMDI